MYPIRDWLLVGKFAQTRDRDLLESHNVQAMLQLAEPYSQAGIETLYLEMKDGEPIDAATLQHGLDFIREHHAAGHVTLLACGAGISRSPLMAMAALMETEGLALFEAYEAVYRQHRGAQPHHELVMSLAAYHGQNLTLLDVWEGLREVQKRVDAE